ncbi:MAG: acetolactate synthase small subunit [Synechococcales cyanobacterium]
MLVQDHPGALSRIAGLFARRGFNIDSLTVGHTERPGISRIIMVVQGDDREVEQINKQLQKLVDVLTVKDITDTPAVERELMLVKVNSTPTTRADIMDVAQMFRARIVDVAEESLTLEVTGDPGKMVAILKMLNGFGIREIARTGLVALTRESGVNTEFLKQHPEAVTV